MKTPDLSARKVALSLDYVNRLLGMKHTREDACALLEKMRHGTEPDPKDKDRIIVLVPPYRTDILHPIDLVEDIAIAYGYQNYVPEMPKISTVGMKDPMEKYASTLRQLMIGLGFQEVMTLIMTSKENLFLRMGLAEEDAVEAENPVSTEHSICRTNLMPSLLSVLEKNKNREYPQFIFEVGECVSADGINQKKISALIAHSRSNYSEVKAVVTGLLDNLGLACDIKPAESASFITGRCASCGYGLFGEIYPGVLECFGLEVPVSGFELALEEMCKKRVA